MEPRDRSRKSSPVLELRPVLGPHHAWAHQPKPAPPHARLHGPNSSANLFLAAPAELEHPNVPEQECPNAKGDLHVRVHPYEVENPVHLHEREATPSNW